MAGLVHRRDAGHPGLDVGQGGLGHERAQPRVFRLLLEEAELLLGDRQLGADALQPFADVDETTLEERL